MTKDSDENAPKFTARFVSHAHNAEEAAEEQKRRISIASAVGNAKRSSAEVLSYVKKIMGSRRIGSTTAEEDITAINLVLDGLMGGMDALADTDAKPLGELEHIKDWDAFKKWAPDEAAQVEAHLLAIQSKAVQRRSAIDGRIKSGELAGEDIETERSLAMDRFSKEKQMVGQLEAWLTLSREGLVRAFAPPAKVADDVQRG